MDEKLFKELLGRAFEQESSELTMAEHRFSLRHRIRMRKVFRQYAKSVTAAAETAARPDMRKQIMVALVVILTAVLLTVTVIGIITNGFKTIEKEDHTEFYPIVNKNAPTIIKEAFELGWIPESFELVDHQDNRSFAAKKYVTDSNYFVVSQYTKSTFYGYIDKESYNSESIMINGCSGVICGKDDVNEIYWTNGDYVISILGNVSKETLVKLAESTKMTNLGIFA